MSGDESKRAILIYRSKKIFEAEVRTMDAQRPNLLIHLRTMRSKIPGCQALEAEGV